MSAKAVHAYITHGVLSGGAVSRVSSSPLETMVITDSILGTEAVRVAGNIQHFGSTTHRRSDRTDKRRSLRFEPFRLKGCLQELLQTWFD